MSLAPQIRAAAHRRSPAASATIARMPRRTRTLRLTALLGLSLAAPACTPTCPKAKVDQTAAYLRDSCALEPIHAPIYLREGAAWPKVDQTAVGVRDAIPVYIYPEGVMFDRAVVTLAEFETLIKEEIEKAEQLAENIGKPWSRRALLGISADVPVEAIPPVVELLHRVGFTELGYLAEATAGPPIPPLPVPGVKNEAAELARTISAEEYNIPMYEARRRLLEAEVARCAPLGKALEDVGKFSHEERCLGFGKSLVAACEECRCSADVARVVSLYMFPLHPELLLVERLATADAPPVTARPGEPWSAVAPRLFAAPGPATRLLVEPAASPPP
jgi:hypothetical protein